MGMKNWTNNTPNHLPYNLSFVYLWHASDNLSDEQIVLYDFRYFFSNCFSFETPKAVHQRSKNVFKPVFFFLSREDALCQ